MNDFNSYKTKILNLKKQIGDICNITPFTYCNGKQPYHTEPGIACCHDCNYHNPLVGCTTESLICMAWYCDRIQDKIPQDILTELWNIIDELSNRGLLVRQHKNLQIEILNKTQ